MARWRCRTFTVVTALLAGAPGPAEGQSSALPDIVVSGRGLEAPPASTAYDVQTVSAARLSATASGRIEDALADVAGFQQFRRSDSRAANPSAQGVTLRALGGNATSRTLVLLDGVPMTDPFFGSIPLSALVPERLAGAQVIRGGGSGAFGAGAVAGTIDLTSADARTLGLFSASAAVDNRGASELSAILAPQLGEGFAVVGARWDRSPGFWTTPLTQRNAASVRARYESWSASLRGVAALAPGIELQARGLAFGDTRTLRFAGAESASSGQDASLRVVMHGAWQFDLLGYLQAREFSNVVISATSLRKTLDQRRTPSTGVGGKIELRPPVGHGQVLRIGADWRISSGRLAEDAYAVSGAVTNRRSAGGRNSDLGFFAEDDWTLGKLVLTGGLRADRWSISQGFFREANAAGTITTDTRFADRAGWDTSLRGGALWHALPGLALRASAYSGSRLPTLNELYRPFVVFPVSTRANAALANEHLRGFEAGFDYSPIPALSLSLTAFDNRVKAAIANVTIAPNLRERRNVDAVHARGLELGGELRRGTVSLSASLALTDAKVEASGISAALNAKRPSQTPKIAASATLAWRPGEGWLGSLTLRHIGAQFEDDLETDVLPAATTLDAVVQLPLAGRFGLVLRAENLTDSKLITRNQAGSIDLGAPRTLWAGIRVALRP